MAGINTTLQGLKNSLSKPLQQVLSGEYITERGANSADIAAFTTKLAQGERSLEQGLTKLSSLLESRGFAVDFEFDKKTNTVILHAAPPEAGKRAREAEDARHLTASFKLDYKGVAGKGRGAKTNPYAAYLTPSGEMELYTAMEAEVDETIKQIERLDAKGKVNTEEAAIGKIQQSINQAIRSVRGLTPSAVRNAEARQEAVRQQRASREAQRNAAHATELFLRRYLDSLVYEKGAGFAKAAYEGVDVSNLMYTVLNSVLQARTPQEIEGLLRQFKSDKRFDPLTKAAGWNNLISRFKAVKEKGLRINAGTTNETAARRLVIGTQQGRHISPGDTAMENSTRQQGFNTVRNNPTSRAKMFSRSRLEDPVGRKLGVRYGQKGGWDSTANIMYISDELLAAATREYRRANPKKGEKMVTPSLREGGMVLAQSLASAMADNERETEFALTPEDFERLQEVTLRKMIAHNAKYRKMFDGFEGLSADERRKKAEELLASEFAEEFKQAMFREKMGREGRHVQGAQLSRIERNVQTGNYHLVGFERLGMRTTERVVDSFGNTRSSASILSDDFIDFVLDYAENHGVAGAASMKGRVKGFGAKDDEVTMRNYGAIFGRELAFLFNNADSAADAIRLLEKIDPELPKQFKLSAHGRTASYGGHDALLHGLTDEQRTRRMMSILNSVREANRQIVQRRSASKVNSDSLRIGALNLGVTDAYAYGDYGRAVSLQSGKKSAQRGAAAVAARGQMTSAQAKSMSAHFEERLGPDKEAEQELRRLEAEADKAIRRTQASAEKDFTIDSEKSISIGFGEQYDINLAEVEREDIDITGRITNLENTLRYKIWQLRQAKAKALGVKEEEIEAFIDDVEMLETKEYTDADGKVSGYTLASKKLVLPSTFGNNGETSYGDYYSSAIDSLIHTLDPQEDLRRYTSAAAARVVGRMYDDTRFKEGSEYQRVYKARTDKSLFRKIEGFNLNDILEDDEYARASETERHRSDLASGGILIDPEDAREILEGMSEEELQTLFKEFYNKDFEGKGSKKKQKRALIEQLRQALTVGSDAYNAYIERVGAEGAHGLRGMTGRLPFMNGEDLAAVDSIFIENALRGTGGMRVGAGLARQKNADYDGDRMAVAIEDSFTEEQKELFRTMAVNQKEIARAMALREKHADTSADPFAFDEAASQFAGIIAKINKQYVGVLSNLSKQARTSLEQDFGADELSLVNKPEGAQTQLKAAAGMFVRAFFESIEQDAISSKKVINRMIKARASSEGVNPEELTDEQKENLYLDSFTDLGKLVESFNSGEVELDSLISKLQTMGVLKEGENFMSGRVVEQVLEIVTRFSHGSEILTKLFGSKEAADKGFAQGAISQEGFLRAMNIATGGNENQFLQTIRSKKRYNPEGISAESNAPYRVGITYEAADVLYATDMWNKLDEARRKNTKTLKDEIELERLKTRIAKGEAAAIAGDAASWGDLTSSLSKTAQAYDTVTERARRLNESGGPKPYATGTAPALGYKAEEIAKADTYDPDKWLHKRGKKRNETDEEYAALPGITMSQRARLLGYKSVKSFKADREDSLKRVRGIAAHGVSEALGSARLSGYNFDSIEQLLAHKDANDSTKPLYKIAENYRKTYEEYNRILYILGYTRKEQERRIQDVAHRGQANFGEIAKDAYGGGGRIISTEAPLRMFDWNGTNLSGKTDVEYTTLDRGGHTQYHISDYKNKTGAPTLSEITQLITYRTMLEQLQKEVREFVKNGGTVADWAKNYSKRTNRDMTVERAQAIHDAWGFNTDLTATGDDGVTHRYDIGSVPEDIKQRILTNQSLKGFDSVLWGAVTERGGKNETASGTKGGKGTGRKGESEEQRNEREREYLALLDQIEALKVQILKLETERTILAKKGESTKAVEDEIAALQKEKGLIEEAKTELEKGGWSKKQEKKIGLQKSINDNQTSYEINKYLAGAIPDAQVKAEKDYEKNLARRLALEKQIEAAKKEIATSVSNREKDAQRDIIRMSLEEIKALDEKRTILEQSGLLRKEEVEQILKQYNLERKTAMSKADANRHGSRNLLDVMKYDIQRSFTRVMDYGVAMRLINSIPRGLQKINTMTQQLEDSLTNLRIVTGMNRQEAEQTMMVYQKMGRELKATTQEVAASATTWLRQGYAVEEAGKLIEASMKLSKLGFMDASTSAQALTAALKGFKLEVSNAMDVVDKLTQMDQKAAVSAQGVSEALSLIANSARLAGLSMDQAIGMVSTIGEVTQQSMSTVGNSAKTMLARFGNVKAGVFSQMGLNDDGETTENINDIEKVLRVVGISIRSASGEMRSFADVLDDLGEKWNTFDSVTKNAIAGALGGVRQREAVNTLLENYDRYKELTEESANSEGTANQKYAAQMESLAAAITDMQNAWEKFVLEVKASSIIKAGVKTLTWFIDNMKTLISLVSTFAGRFAAIKLPAWLPKLGGLLGMGGNRGQRLKYNLLGAQRGGVAKQEAYAQKTNNRIDRISGASDAQLRSLAEEELRGGESGVVVSRKAIDKRYKKLKKQQTAIQEGRIKKIGEDTKEIDKTDVTPVVNKLADTNNIVQQILSELQKRAAEEGAKTRAAKGVASKNGADPDAAGATGAPIADANGKFFDASGREIKQNKKGQWQYAAGVKGADGKAIGGRYVAGSAIPTGSAKATPEADKKTAEDTGKAMAQAVQKESKKSSNTTIWQQGRFKGYGTQVAGSIGSGLAVGLTSAMTKNEVVDGAMTWGGRGKKAKEAGISIEADAGDKAIQGVSQGVATAGLSLIPVVGPILGPVLGPLLGGAVGDIISFFRHEDEIDRKLRVEEAKKQLEALNAINEGVASLEELNKNRVWSSEDYSEAKKQVDVVSEKFADNKDLQKAFIQAMEQAGFTKDSWQSLLNNLLSPDQVVREKTLNVLNGILLEDTRKQLVASHEEINYSGSDSEKLKARREEMEAEVDEAMQTSGLKGYTEFQRSALGFEGAVQTLANFMEQMGLQVRDASGKIVDEYRRVIENKLKTDDKWARTVGNQSTSVESLFENEEQFGKALTAIQSQDGSVDSYGAKDYLGNWTNRVREGRASQVRDLSITRDSYLDTVRSYDKQIDAAVQGAQNNNYRGPSAESLRKSKETYISQHKQEYEDAVRQIEILQDEKDIAMQAEKEMSELAKTVGLSLEEFQNAVYTWDDEGIMRMAKGLGLSVDQLREMKGELKDITFGDITADPSQSRVNREQYLSYYNDFVQNGTLSKENLEKAITANPELAALAGDREGMRAYLEKQAFGEDTRDQILYRAQMYNKMMDSFEFFQAQRTASSGEGDLSLNDRVYKAFEEREREIENDGSLSENERTATLKELKQKRDSFKQAKSFNSAQEAIEYLKLQSGDAAKAVGDKMSELLSQEVEYTVDTTQLDRVIEYQTKLIDKQIKNLEEQKEALQSVNDQRKKELDYIKAQIALENTSKEKKRVYRAGVGMTYEEDQEAVKQAQEAIDTQENEREQELLDLQIERLELEREILEFLPDEKAAEELYNTYQTWIETMGDKGLLGQSQSITDSLTLLYKDIESFSLHGMSAAAWAEEDKLRNQSAEEILSQFDKVLSAQTVAQTAVNERTEGGVGVKAASAVGEYNSQRNELASLVQAMEEDGVSRQEIEQRLTQAIQRAEGDVQKDEEGNVVLDENGVAKTNATVSDSIKKKVKDIMNPNSSFADISLGGGTLEMGTMGTQKGKASDDETVSAGSHAISEEQLMGTAEEYNQSNFKEQFEKDKYTSIRFYDPAKDQLRMKGGPKGTGVWTLSQVNNAIAAGQTDPSNPYYQELKELGVDVEHGAYNFGRLREFPIGTAFSNEDFRDYGAFVGGQHKIYGLGKLATGTLGTAYDGAALINELGTEAIITPQGTVTALPSKTGIVPADITKNLWALGEAAPNLIARLGSINLPEMSSNNSTTHNDGTFIDTLNMTVYPTRDYDMDRFIQEAKQRARISNHNN